MAQMAQICTDGTDMHRWCGYAQIFADGVDGVDGVDVDGLESVERVYFA